MQGMGRDDTHTVYLSLGSNLGNRRQNMLDAIRMISQRVGQVERQSAFHDTAPWGFSTEHRFLNACVKVYTDLSPRRLLDVTQQIERELGRNKTAEKEKEGRRVYHDRTIDIDILTYDDLKVDESGLQIPHPRMLERDFVMVPLREIWSEEADIVAAVSCQIAGKD